MRLQATLTDATLTQIDNRALSRNGGLGRSEVVESTLSRYFALLDQGRRSLAALDFSPSDFDKVRRVTLSLSFNAWSIRSLWMAIADDCGESDPLTLTLRDLAQNNPAALYALADQLEQERVQSARDAERE